MKQLPGEAKPKQKAQHPEKKSGREEHFGLIHRIPPK